MDECPSETAASGAWGAVRPDVKLGAGRREWLAAGAGKSVVLERGDPAQGASAKQDVGAHRYSPPDEAGLAAEPCKPAADRFAARSCDAAVEQVALAARQKLAARRDSVESQLPAAE
jgi:hypothetical protein